MKICCHIEGKQKLQMTCDMAKDNFSVKAGFIGLVILFRESSMMDYWTFASSYPIAYFHIYLFVCVDRYASVSMAHFCKVFWGGQCGDS